MASSTIQICSACNVPETPTVTHKRCINCLTVRYCSRTCQKTHWKVHKPNCTAVVLPSIVPTTTTTTSSSVIPDRKVPPATTQLVPKNWNTNDGSRPLMRFAMLGIDLRVTNTMRHATVGTSCAASKSDIALYTTLDRKAGDLVFRESTNLLGTYEKLVSRIMSYPWHRLMFPRSETKVSIDSSYSDAVKRISKRHPRLTTDEVRRLITKVQSNMFATESPLTSTSSLQYEDSPSRPPLPVEKRYVAIFPLAQFANHACTPNVLVIIVNNAQAALLEMYALQDISAGSQLVHAYDEREGESGRKKPFSCNCTTCHERSKSEGKSLESQLMDKLQGSALEACLAATTSKFTLDADIDVAFLTKMVVRANKSRDAPQILDASPHFEETSKLLPC